VAEWEAAAAAEDNDVTMTCVHCWWRGVMVIINAARHCWTTQPGTQSWRRIVLRSAAANAVTWSPVASSRPPGRASVDISVRSSSDGASLCRPGRAETYTLRRRR